MCTIHPPTHEGIVFIPLGRLGVDIEKRFKRQTVLELFKHRGVVMSL